MERGARGLKNGDLRADPQVVPAREFGGVVAELASDGVHFGQRVVRVGEGANGEFGRRVASPLARC